MGVYFQYSKVQPNEIARALSGAFGEIEQESQLVLARPVNSNMIILLSSGEPLKYLDGFIDAMAAVRPSRFFIMVMDQAEKETRAEIALRCQGISRTRHVCSEVIRLYSGGSTLEALLGLVRANLIPGMSTELFLFDGGSGFEVIEKMTVVADALLFDSGMFDGRGDTLSRLAELPVELVDLQWLELGAWRTEIKTAFEKYPAEDLLAGLERIEIEAEVPESIQRNQIQAACLLLIAGWFVERLNLEVVCCTTSGCECYSPYGKMVRIVLNSVSKGERSRLARVRLIGRGHTGESVSISFQRKGLLRVVVEGEGTNFGVDERESTLEKSVECYIKEGRPGLGYPAVLKNAVDIGMLAQTFDN